MGGGFRHWTQRSAATVRPLASAAVGRADRAATAAGGLLRRKHLAVVRRDAVVGARDAVERRRKCGGLLRAGHLYFAGNFHAVGAGKLGLPDRSGAGAG